MATENGERVQKMHPDDIVDFVRTHQDPGVTASEIAEEFDVTNKAVRYRLKQLEERGCVYGKDVGASAKIWFPEG